MSIVNLLRIAVILLGGSVVGTGFAVLLERARFYARNDLPNGRRAMALLAAMNVVVMLYLTFILIQRWDDPLTWRWGGALLIFLLKGSFFHELRMAGIEQDRRQLFGEHP